VCIQQLNVRTQWSISICMNQNQELLSSPESRRPDRFFVARIDGRETVFVLHSDHTLCIAPATQPVTSLVESAVVVLGEVSGLAA
jgi:hypothetical protein